MSLTVYKSSAGSGKTFTLVKEYIKLAILKPGNFKHILAITFTNKAAGEMKERVIKYLTDLSAQPFDKSTQTYKFLLPELIKDSKLTAEEIAVKARQVLNSILHNYSCFAIGTIDGFVHRIIRTFAHDLKIPMNFEVVMDTDKLLSEAIDLLLNKAGSDVLLTKALVEFIETKTDDEKSWHIENDLLIFARQLMMEDNLIHIEKISDLSIQDFLDIRKKLGFLITQFESEITKIATGADKLITDAGIPLAAFYQGEKGIGKYFRNLANGIMDKVTPNSYVLTTVEQDKWYAGKTAPGDKNKIDGISSQLSNAFLEIAQLKAKRYHHYVLHRLIHANIYPVTVLNEIKKITEEIKNENNILPISEFNRLISRIVISQPAPFIYERLGEKFLHYLVDEFQDTSTLQWMNLLPLIENSLSYGRFNMIVGDGKQAIYRWRGGDVEQFALLPSLPKVITGEFSRERAAAIARNCKEERLSSNFRSKAEIIDFNNKFFNHVCEISSGYIRSIYRGCEQTFNIENTGGYVEINFTEEGINSDETYDDITVRKILEIIEETKGHSYTYRDIAILCRSNNNASVIARHLTEKGINVVSEESLLISGSHEVNFLLALVSYIANADDEIAKYSIIQYLISRKMVSDNNIFSVCKMLWKGNNKIYNKIDCAAFDRYLQKNNFILDSRVLVSLPVFEMFGELISIFGLNKITDPYVQFFLDAVLEFSAGKKNNISEFFNWWNDKKDNRSIIIPEGIDAVNIMTIHKSKGLEFPVVIYPYAKEKFRNTRDNMWVSTDIPEIPKLHSALVRNNETLQETDYSDAYLSEKDKSLLDLLNVLYVVMTRPSERLYILTKPPSKNAAAPNSVPGFLYSFIQSTGRWNDLTSVYCFGEKTPKPRQCEKKKDRECFSIIDYPVRKRDQIIHLRKKATYLWDTEDPLRNSEWGNLIHYTLSLITDAGDADKVILQLTQRGLITKEKGNELSEKVKAIISDPSISAYYQPGHNVKTETEILLKNGLTVRPDRVIIDGNKAIVIDYKTGNPYEKHKTQIEEYTGNLEEMGYLVTEKILVYVDLNKAERV